MIDNISHYIYVLLLKMFSHIWLKLTGVLGYFSLSFFFDSLHTEALFALFFLIVGDFITALFSAYKNKEEIQSKKVVRSAWKIILYFSMISAGYLTETAGLTFLPIDETIIIVLAVTELISILENVSYMGFVIPKKLLNKLRDIRDGGMDN